MRFVIITGLSGAGISTAIKIMEDLGYFCIDNLPPSLIPKIANICSHSDGKIDKVAVVIDSRVGNLFKDIFSQLSHLEDIGYTYEILYLEAADEVLVKRYKENRRTHPLAREGRILMGIKEERKILKHARTRANYIVDTSNMSPRQLKEYIAGIFFEDKKDDSLAISIISFGFKHGMPIDVDMVFDIRFIPNPFYIESMKNLNGLDDKVKEYVMEQDETKAFLSKLNDMLEFLIPNYIKEGKSQLVIGIGCTGGCHRSVVIAQELFDNLEKNGHRVSIEHRDVSKNSKNA